MTPHIGQDLWLSVKESDSGEEITREKVVVEEAFTISVEEIEAGKSYVLDFYADHNENGMYDAPSTDHAWRIEVMNAEENGSVDFVHNTDFTDIFEETTSGRANQLTEISIYPNPATDILEITSGNENAGIQELSIYAVTGKKIETVKAQNSRKVQVDISYLQTGIYILLLKTENATETLRFIKK